MIFSENRYPLFPDHAVKILAGHHKKSPGPCRGFWSLKFRENSVPRDRAAEVIVEADAQNIVGEMRGVRHRNRAAERVHNRRGGRTGVDGAEVHVEILKLCSPV